MSNREGAHDASLRWGGERCYRRPARSPAHRARTQGDRDLQVTRERRTGQRARRRAGHARRAVGACVAPHRRGCLMPVGYWWTVAFLSWGVVCALTRWRRLGPVSAIPALLVS